MSENTSGKVFTFGNNSNNVTSRGLHEEEEAREQDLYRRNEIGYNMGRNYPSGTISDSLPEYIETGADPRPQSGTAGAGVETPSTQNVQAAPGWSSNPVSQFFSKKSDKRREEAENWEAIGDEDTTGNDRGNFRMRRLFWEGSLDSQGCPTASAVEVKYIFRHIIMNLGAYGEDESGLTKAIKEHDPLFDQTGVVRFQRPKEPGACPPYFIYVDHQNKEVSMYIRGLNLMHHEDYVTLLSNRRGEKKFDGGYVHHGMSGPANWAVKNVGPILKNHLVSNKGYRLTIVGHSLGAGVASLLTLFLVNDTEVLGGISPDSIRCIAIAPPRVMSLDLAFKCAPYISSVIYQDDFLPRVSTQSVKRLFLTTLALAEPFLIIFWLKQVMKRKGSEADVHRLFPPGKIYHFVYKQPGKSIHRPIRARVAPAASWSIKTRRGQIKTVFRFERLALSSSGTIKNHYILALAKHIKKYNWPEQLKDEWLTSVLQTA